VTTDNPVEDAGGPPARLLEAVGSAASAEAPPLAKEVDRLFRRRLKDGAEMAHGG